MRKLKTVYRQSEICREREREKERDQTKAERKTCLEM